MANKRFVNHDLEKYRDGKVKMVGKFIYHPKHCKILNCDTLQEFMIEKNDVFIARLKSGVIPNVKLNKDLRYIFKEIVLYGHVDKMQHSYIFMYEGDNC